MMFGTSPTYYVKTVHLPTVLVAVCVALLLAACEDATNVGEELVGARGGHPESVEIPITDGRPAELIRPSNLPPRLLAGSVDDPALGTYAVEGYFDVTPVSSEDFRAQTVETVELRLEPSYVYGDTTSEITLALREITEDWDPAGLPTDTSFAVGPVIREFSFLPTDTLVVVSLPESWVEEHEDVYRSAQFGDLFHGFRLDPVSGNAVVGFGPNNTSVFAATADESISSPVGITYQHAERLDAVELSPDRFLMQAGSGPILSFSLLEENETVPPSSVNQAALTFFADVETVSDDTPQHFVRPTLQTLDLYGVTADGVSALLARSTLNDAGQFIFATQTVARTIQEKLAGGKPFDRFEIRIPDPNTLSTNLGDAVYYYTSLNPIVLFDAGAADKAPTGFITITPLD